MAVRGVGVSGSAFLRPHTWRHGVARSVRGLVRLPSDHKARHNAQLAAAALARRRHEREEVDRFLTAHAAPADDESAVAV